MYDSILKQFVLSKDMRDYLSSNENLNESASYIEDIIFYAPISIERKLVGLHQIEQDVREDVGNRIRETDDKKIQEWKQWRHENRIKDYECYIRTIQLALDLSKEDAAYVLESGEYDETKKDCDRNFECVFASFDEVENWIRKDIEGYEADFKLTHWYEISRWIKSPDGKYRNTCTYIFFNGKVCYVDFESYCAEKYEVESLFCYDINLKVPFHPGDIIEVDGSPFSPKYRALITNIGDNKDCCCVQALALNADGKWQVGALKHNQVGYAVYPYVSALYTARIYGEELNETEKILLELQRYVNGSEERGDRLWDYVFKTNLMSSDELRNFLTMK